LHLILTEPDTNKQQVNFNGEDDPLDPKNWPSKKKWAATAVTAAFTFVSPLASSMIAPALRQMAKEFDVTNKIEIQMMLSIFVLAYAIGPMFLGPLSELYGRSLVLQISNLVFLVFNTAAGWATSKEQILAFRFLSGIGGSAPLAIGGGVLGDLFKPEERGKAMGLYAMGPLLGPAVGPIVGSWVAQYSTWRWIFWSSSIADVFITISGVIWLHESYAPYILHKKAKKLRKETGNNAYRAEGEGELNQPVFKKVATTMGRSFAMLFTQPIVQVMSVYMAFSYGVLYLGLSTLPTLFAGEPPKGYGQSLGLSGLNYIALGLGFFFGAPICGKTSDTMYQYFKKKDPRGQGKPEYRMPLVIPFSFLVPIGLLIYGWSAEYLVHWIVPDIGLFIFGMGTIAAFQCVTTYLVDTYARYAASAVAAVTILRSLAGFTFPLFAPSMFDALGNGWGNTVLALAAVGIGIPIPILLWMFGEKLRKRSNFATKKPPPGADGRAPGSKRIPPGQAPSGPQGPPPPFSEGKRRHG
jgi:multidrug resistance protein